MTFITPTGKPPPPAVRLVKALPFRRAQRERRDALTAHDDLHTADDAHAYARVGIVSDHMARAGRRYDTSAMAAGGLQGLQVLSPRQRPPLGAFIKLPALRIVHDCSWLGKEMISLSPPPRRTVRTSHLVHGSSNRYTSACK